MAGRLLEVVAVVVLMVVLMELLVVVLAIAPMVVPLAVIVVILRSFLGVLMHSVHRSMIVPPTQSHLFAFL